jgi:hypothetical protein
MAMMLSAGDVPPDTDIRTLHLIRQKFREVFGCEATLSDDVLVRRYRVTGDGDLIMIIR